MTSQQQDVSLFDLKSDGLCAAHVLMLDARSRTNLPTAAILIRRILFHQWHKGGVTNHIATPILTIRLKGACDEVASRVKFCETILHGSYTSGS